MKAVHYLNQFFAGLGAEEAAETEPTRLDGAVGPGRGLQPQLEGVEIAATIACGDDYFAEHEDEALEQLLALIEAEAPAVLIAGPAFGTNRLLARPGVPRFLGTLIRAGNSIQLPCVRNKTSGQPASQRTLARIVAVLPDARPDKVVRMLLMPVSPSPWLRTCKQLVPANAPLVSTNDVL